MNITMMQSINSIHNCNTGIIKKTVPSIKMAALSVRDARRAVILAMMSPGVYVTSTIAAKKTRSAKSTCNGDLNFLLKSGACKSRLTEKSNGAGGMVIKEYFIAYS